MGNRRIDGVDIAGVNEADEIVGSRRKHRQLKVRRVYVGIDVVKHSNRSLSQ